MTTGSCQTCGDPLDGPAGFVTISNRDYLCVDVDAHNDGSAPKGAPQDGDQARPTEDDTPKGYPPQRTDQLRLGEQFPAPLVRRDDPQTSRQAADAVHHSGGVQRRAVLAAYQIHRELTSEEAAVHAGIEKDSARSRISELRALGVLEDSGSTRLSSRKRPATVWRLVS